MILRPGRIDVVIYLDKPDEEAVTRLVRNYGKDSLDPQADLTDVGRALAHQIPAIIREVVERAKLRALTRSEGSSSIVVAQDLVETAESYLRTQARLNPPAEKEQDFMYQFGSGFGQEVAKAVAVEAARYFAQMHFDPSQNGHKAGAKLPALAG
jgi:SpoVK/Ycf46/Vps4 family AAA+-type ATPase